MKILNTDTKEIIELELINTKTGCSYIADFIDSGGGFTRGDFKKVDAETHGFEATARALNYWTRAVALQKEHDAWFAQQVRKCWML